MNALPSMLVLDFFEWLKDRIDKQRGENYIDILALIFNSEYSSNLKLLAKEYLRGNNVSLRNLLHSFIDSEEFVDYCHIRCHSLLDKRWNLSHRPHLEELRYLLYKLFHCSGIEEAFCHFIRDYEDNRSNGYIYDGCITPEMLIEKTRIYFEKYPKKCLMTELSADLSLEINFLEWLMLNKGKPMNLKKMPISLFESIAEEYCVCVKRPVDDKKKLIRAFKQNDPVTLGKKLVAVLTHSQYERMKSFGYIYDRYVDENIPFRCFFLSLASTGDAYEKFIKKHWFDLDALSGNYLDIYYSKEDYGKSGFAIKDSMKMVPKDLPGTLPCLVIWKNNLQSAQVIDIRGLTDQEIVRLISVIVDLIKEDNTLDYISKEAKKMVKQINQARIDAGRPTNYNTFNIENNTGIVTGCITNGNVTVHTGSITNAEFDNETKEAIKIISSFHNVKRDYKDALISLVKEANIATQNKDEIAKSECRNKYKGFVLGAGNAVNTIITKLSELATIAGFFGITVNTLL